MDKEYHILKFGIVIIILVLFNIAKYFYKVFVKSKMPKEQELGEYVNEAKELKLKGLSYQERITYFQSKSLHKKVAENIIILAENE